MALPFKTAGFYGVLLLNMLNIFRKAMFFECSGTKLAGIHKVFMSFSLVHMQFLLFVKAFIAHNAIDKILIQSRFLVMILMLNNCQWSSPSKVALLALESKGVISLSICRHILPRLLSLVARKK